LFATILAYADRVGGTVGKSKGVKLAKTIDAKALALARLD
jgi:hypothetical protein